MLTKYNHSELLILVVNFAKRPKRYVNNIQSVKSTFIAYSWKETVEKVVVRDIQAGAVSLHHLPCSGVAHIL